MPETTDPELFSRLYGWLGDRTSNPDGDEWQHEALQRLVRDLMTGPLAEERDKVRAPFLALADRIDQRHYTLTTPVQRVISRAIRDAAKDVAP